MMTCQNQSDNSSSDTSSSEEEDDGLSEVLRTNLVHSVFGNAPHEFLPAGILKKHITKTTIEKSLKLKGSTKKDVKLVSFILERATKLFAISVFTGLGDDPKTLKRAMMLFKDNDFDDSKLPVERVPSTQAFPDHQLDTYSQTLDGGRPTLLSLEEGQTKKIWAKRGRQFEFCRNQWLFLAPEISTAQASHVFEESLILPFVSKHFNSGQGAFGVVSKYVVHPDHIVGPPELIPKDRAFAVKEIKADNKEDAQQVAKHWESEVKALRRMNELNQHNIVRFITAFRRRKRDGEEHYLMFEWADRGNLRDMWKSIPHPVISASLVKEVIQQIHGLATALDAAHNLNQTGSSYRHGDLKPENILCFSGVGIVGLLKIGDWGEAKGHNVVTELRPTKTTAKYGTRRYEAPEVETGMATRFLGQPIKRRSRLYDIWAMGCITLEFVVWLLYGEEGLQNFNRSFENSPFYQVTITNGVKTARVHDSAVSWMEHIAREPSCQPDTALGRILELIREGLLVVKLPQRLGSDLSSYSIAQSLTESVVTNAGEALRSNFETANTEQASSIPQINIVPPELPKQLTLDHDQQVGGLRSPSRCLARELRIKLDEILDEDEVEEYWYPQQAKVCLPLRFGAASPSATCDNVEYYSGDATIKRTTDGYETMPNALLPPHREKVDYASPELDEDDWEFHVDNAFASEFFHATASDRDQRAASLSNVCIQCSAFSRDLWNPGFEVTYHVRELELRARVNNCRLCQLLWTTCQRHEGLGSLTVLFERTGSCLKMNGGILPVLTTFRNDIDEDQAGSEIQIGFADLPTPGGSTHLALLRQWLDHCDKKHIHTTCRAAENDVGLLKASTKRMPTRLIDVGCVDDDMVRLWETQPHDTAPWIALSHQWGYEPHFSTDRRNIAAHISGIKLEDLPATFKDAVLLTRGIGCRYLWIDSICVIQGSDGDFTDEAKRMGEVYSGAYVVLAASCATDHRSGFLQPRTKKNQVALQRDDRGEKKLFTICETIDNFQEHVLEGALNRRGWVLQEHALARRTIFFTKHQTYFECGSGVRCETMTRMTNNLAAFLGDPNFPQILSNAPQGERIHRYQELYKKYSRLGLSYPPDRPTAIDGLQKRLLRTMNVRGGFGVFDEGVTRGLLRRSLLWRRGRDTMSLTRIQFPADRKVSIVPSWSWMAYIGGIDYLELNFGNIDWEDIQSPWSQNLARTLRTEDRFEGIALTGSVREYDPGAAKLEEGELIFDTPGGTDRSRIYCVVLGKEKGNIVREEQRHYVLLVTQVLCDRDGSKLFERVGTGYFPGKCIANSVLTAHII